MPADEASSAKMPDRALSNPASTGSAGPRFEVQVMSKFAVLMLAGGVVPCLEYALIKKIKLQERKAGCRVDDFVVHAADSDESRARRLLVQVKLGISFTASDEVFAETIAAAWKDFNSPLIFARGQDAIAIATGPLSATDIADLRTILDWARARTSASDFFNDVSLAKFSSDAKRTKLAAIRHHINAAAQTQPSDDDVFQFLRHFHVLGYDLDAMSGVTHALLRTIVGCFQSRNPRDVWARILEVVTAFNPMAGTLTEDNFPDDIRMAFKPRAVVTMPSTLAATIPPKEEYDWNQSEYAEALTIANLLGGWNDRSHADMAILAAFATDKPDVWLSKMRAVLQHPDSPLAHQNGVWTVKHRVKLWTRLESRIFDSTLETFRICAKTVLGEVDPKFELDPDKRYAATIYGKILEHSEALRTGISETLALLGTNAAKLVNCGAEAGEGTAMVVVRGLLERADWKIWGGVDRLLPTLAEASPGAFMTAVEAALSQNPPVFDVLFAQRGDPMFSGSYLCGLLWALETLAWDEPNLVRVSVILAKLAARDPGGNSGNTPANSLTMIFLPWLPQTKGSVAKRRVAVDAVVHERREVGWKLLKSLLPSQHGVSTYTSKPKWRNKLNDDDDSAVPRPTTSEYWEQVTSYAKMAGEIVRVDPDKLAELIGLLDSLPEAAFTDVLAHLESEAVIGLPDEQRLPIWTKLTSFSRKHRAHADAKWALPAEAVDQIERTAAVIIPKDPFVAHRILFSKNTWDLHDDHADWQKNEERLAERQLNAIDEIYKLGGLESVISFSKTVENPWSVGFAIGKLELNDVATKILPHQIDPLSPLWQSLAHGFVWALWQRGQWAWVDSFDTSAWTPEQIAQFLIYLPFEPGTWKRADERLGAIAAEYWKRYPVGELIRGDKNQIAIDAFMAVNRPRAAVACLAGRVFDKQSVDPVRAVDALLAAVSSKEIGTKLDPYHTATVIKAIQEDPTTDKSKLIAVEWAYLAWLTESSETTAKTLNASIAENPESFCQIIRMIFRSDSERADGEKPEPTADQRAVAENAYRLLRSWNTVPGTQPDGSISADALRKWIDDVRNSLKESGHFEVGLQKAGEVFLHAPADPDGLFIHRAVAETLNRDDDMDQLRQGYELAVHNSRGVHFVDPMGAPERELAKNYREKADAVENAGFHRLATTLRSISDSYEREAERNIARHKAERDVDETE